MRSQIHFFWNRLIAFELVLSDFIENRRNKLLFAMTLKEELLYKYS
jgi:hypothetical protein